MKFECLVNARHFSKEVFDPSDEPSEHALPLRDVIIPEGKTEVPQFREEPP